MITKLFSVRVSCWLTVFIFIFSGQIRVSNTGAVVESADQSSSADHSSSAVHSSSDYSYAKSDIRLVSILETFYPGLNESTVALISSSNSTVRYFLSNSDKFEQLLLIFPYKYNS